MVQSDAELEARLAEQDEFEPTEEFVAQTDVSGADTYDELEEDWPDCRERTADLLDWDVDYDEVPDDSNPPFYERFTGGGLNTRYNCADRHVENGDKNRVTIKWESEYDETRTYTYQDLYREVNEFAAALRDLGVEEDDVVMLYMSMVPEFPIAMLACARIGAPHDVVSAGSSAEALATRMNAADSQFLVTCDGYYRRGGPPDHLGKTNEGLGSVDHGVDATVVVDQLGDDGLDHDPEGNQHDWDGLLGAQSGEYAASVERDAENMLFLMYISGTTGQPRGVKHTTGSYLSYATWTSHAALDIETEDTYWCLTDTGWITSHSYIVYGPLTLGSTTVMYEGTPDFPNCDRMWEPVEKYVVNTFYTMPTTIRAFMRWGNKYPESRDLSSLRLSGTVGRPINPRAWKWYYEHIGNENYPVVDTWWQTEIGGMMITTFPGVKSMKPGLVEPPLLGIDVQIVDTDGDEVEPGRAGYLTVNKSWPGVLRTLYGNDERYISEYWTEYFDTNSDNPNDWVYSPEDGAKVDEDGYIIVLDYVDDVINVSGHRPGTMEVESAIIGVEGAAGAVIVGGNHEAKGEAICVYIITEDGYEEGEDPRARIVEGVEDTIDPTARPEQVVFAPELPKTRSGKIMRRPLEGVVNGAKLDNTSTLRNPEIVGEIEVKARAQSD